MRKPARAVGAAVLVVACTGLDPGKFRPDASPPAKHAVAGYAFDAGPGPDRAGASGSRATGGASSGARPSSGSGSGSDGGGAGEDEGGAGGFSPDPGRGGTSAGNAGHGGVGGGRSGSGGVGGRDSGSGRGGSTGAGGKAGAGTAAGNGAGGGAGNGAGPTAHALFFSEYVEGSSSYKALELTAREDSTLAGCRLVTYFNGSSSGSGIALDGALPDGSAYVLCTTALATLVGPACHRATNLTFNGDDAVALECDGTVLDVIGQIGVDPGDAWGSGDASTLNHTLRRSCSSSSGDRDGSDGFDPASEWEALPVDTFDGLGLSACSGG